MRRVRVPNFCNLVTRICCANGRRDSQSACVEEKLFDCLLRIVHMNFECLFLLDVCAKSRDDSQSV